MRKIIPFKKDLFFNTKITEITSISLEHKLTLKNESMLSGYFLISGDYKIAEGNINREAFEFNLPFDIALGTKIDIENMVLDIDDFYYDIDNNKLKVTIDVLIEGEEIIEPPVKEEIDDNKNIEIKEEIDEVKEVKTNLRDIPLEEDIIFDKPELVEDIGRDIINEVGDIPILNEEKSLGDTIKEQFNIFNNLENNETYISYRVYVVKEDDTLELIMKKYNVTKEDLENYNNLEEIKFGDKIIIPYVRNE